MRTTIPLLGPNQESRSIKVNAQRSLNLYPSLEKPGAKGEIVLYGTDGLSLTSEPTAGPCRSNGVPWKGSLYFVIGANLIKTDAAGNGVVVGTLNTSAGRCSLARGRTYLGIVDGTNGYSWNGTSFAQITDPDFPNGATHMDYLDGFFIVNNPGTDEYAINQALEDITIWDPLDINQALASPDDILALIVANRIIYLFGDTTTEGHFPGGNPDFPFEPFAGDAMQIGIAAIHSVVKSVLGVFLLATNEEGDAQVVRINGLQAVPVSDEDLTWQINEIADTSDAIGSIYRRAGHAFYVLTFPSGDRTWVLDITTGLWHERKSFGIGRWRGAGIGSLSGKIIVGDYANGKIYLAAHNKFTENGALIQRLRRTQVVHSSGRIMTFNEVVLDIQSGVGLTSGQGSDPQMFMRYSDDGAKTWSSEIWQSMGKIGEYRQRLIWRQLGDSFERIFEFSFTDPVESTIVGAYADIEVNEE